MRYILVLLIVLCSTFCLAQKNTLPEAKASFVAIIVDDIEESIQWYKNALGFELINSLDHEERRFKQANLTTGTIDLELIELEASVSQSEALEGQQKGLKLMGFFKFGLKVQNFDTWIEHLEKRKVKFAGSVVTDDNSGKRMLVINDLDGNRIQLFEQ